MTLLILLLTTSFAAIVARSSFYSLRLVSLIGNDSKAEQVEDAKVLLFTENVSVFSDGSFIGPRIPELPEGTCCVLENQLFPESLVSEELEVAGEVFIAGNLEVNSLFSKSYSRVYVLGEARVGRCSQSEVITLWGDNLTSCKGKVNELVKKTKF